MKRMSPIFFIILLVINLVAGFILSCYPFFNIALNCAVLLCAIGFTYWGNNKFIPDAFKMSLAFILPTMTIIEIVLGVLAPSQFQDNWAIIAILFCIAFESLLICSITRKSKSNPNKL